MADGHISGLTSDYVLSATGVCAGVIESGWSRLELQRHWLMPVMPEAVGDKQIMVCVNTNEDSLVTTAYDIQTQGNKGTS